MPQDTPLANVEECSFAGDEVILVEGLISDAAAMAGERALTEGWIHPDERIVLFNTCSGLKYIQS